MTNARFAILSILGISTSAFLAQFAIEFSSENLAATCIVFASSLSIIGYMAWSKGLENNPLSTFSIFGFCVTTQLGALIIQSALWTPLIKDLRQPLTTFSVLAAAQLIALGTHALYRLFSNQKSGRQSIARSLLEAINIYKTPSAGALWVLGLIGFAAFVLGHGGQNVFNKVNQAVMFLAWAPFLIPMYVNVQGPEYCNKKTNYIFLSFYISLIVALGLAINARGIMLSGFITIGLFALLTSLRSKEKVSQKLILKLIVGAIMIGVMSIPLTELATAMVIARKARGTVSAVKMIEDTIYYVQQPSVLKERRESDKAAARTSSYDETYIANPLAARFIETKFHDNALYFASILNEKQQSELADKSLDFVLAILPEPIIDMLHIDIKKSELQFSLGDYITYLAIGGGLGSYKTGSALAHGIGIFGFFFAFIYAAICLVMFSIMDLLSTKTERGKIAISALGMLSIWKYFQYGITAESLHYIVSNIFRVLPQTILFYAMFYAMSNLLLKMLFGKALSGTNRITSVNQAISTHRPPVSKYNH